MTVPRGEVLYWHEDGSAEQWGVDLVQTAVWRLAEAGPWPSVAALVEGPHFVYERGRDLFLGRRGRGPLWLAWDTNLLIDYFDHGKALWTGSELPAADDKLGENLEALQIVMALWVLRDIRIVLLPGILSDARKRLSEQRRSDRINAFAEFARAISLTTDDPAPSPDPPLHLPMSALERALESVPSGGDRMLVGQAVRAGVHAFLTRDEGVLASAATLRPFGLAVVDPQDLLEHLAACGALFCLLEQRQMHWPFPDLQRVTHLARAIPGLEVPRPQMNTFTMDDVPSLSASGALDPVLADILRRISQ